MRQTRPREARFSEGSVSTRGQVPAYLEILTLRELSRIVPIKYHEKPLHASRIHCVGHMLHGSLWRHRPAQVVRHVIGEIQTLAVVCANATLVLRSSAAPLSNSQWHKRAE